MANVTLQIPDELIARLGETPAAREKFAREAVAVAAVRLGLLYKPEARQIAGQTRAGFLHVLGQHKVPDDIDADAVVEGYQAIEKLFPK